MATTQIIKPIILPIRTMDSTIGATLPFRYTGSGMIVGNELRIKRIDTGEYVYSFYQGTLDRIHVIAPNKLTNGIVYGMDMRVKLKDGTYSEYSEIVKFKALTKPTLDIASIDGKGFVYNTDVTFTADYTQIEDEKVESYRWYLYDENDVLLMAFPIKTFIQYISQEVVGLEKNRRYSIECKIETVNGISHRIKESFIPLYVVPTASGDIKLSMNQEEGFADIQCVLKQVVANGIYAKNKDGSTAIMSEYKFNDKKAIILSGTEKISYVDLKIPKDFIAKIWVTSLEDDKVFATMYSEDKTFKYVLKRLGNKVTCDVVKDNVVLSTITSNERATGFLNSMIVLKLKDGILTLNVHGGL